jgi:hypothetical protein
MSPRTLVLTALALSVGAGAVEAQESAGIREWLRPRATIRTSGWTSSRTMDSRGARAESVLWVDVAPRLSSGIELRTAGWAGAGNALEPSDVEAELRELYLRFGAGPVDVRLGKQIVAWGRTDALNPTDNLSPRDYTLLVAEDLDQKTGIPAARVAVPLGGTTIAAYWIADFEGHTLPRGAIPAGLPVRDVAPTRKAEQGAVRIERSGGAVDWSISYFNGFDLTPDLSLRYISDVPTLEFAHHRLQVIGADAATTVGRVGVRGEAAWLRTEDSDGDDPRIKNSTLYAVFGADRTWGGYFNVNLQYVVRWVDGFGQASSSGDPYVDGTAALLDRVSQQQREVQHGVTLRVADQWRQETIAADISMVALIDPGQLLIRPSFSYVLSDRWKVLVGADLYHGEDGSQFGDLEKNSLGYFEVRLGLP